MKLIVYKGFDNSFLSNQEFPLIQNLIEDKTNIFKLDADYEEIIQMKTSWVSAGLSMSNQ